MFPSDVIPTLTGPFLWVCGFSCTGFLASRSSTTMQDVRNLAATLHTSCAPACNTDTTQTQPYQISNTQQNKNKTTNVVIQQHSRKLLMADILMSETC